MGKKDNLKGIQLKENTKPITEKINSQQLSSNKQLIETLITKDDSLELENYTLDKSGITICSSRGGTIPSLILDGIEIFYNDPEKRNDFSKSLRESFWMGPQAGPFTQEQNEKYGFNLKQHGFLRDVQREKKGVEGNKLSHQFNTNQDTLESFPYNFTTTQEINLGKKGAHIALAIENKSDEVIRFAPGHHTYYRIPLDKKNNIRLSENMGVSEDMKTKRTSGEETIKIKNPGSCQVYIPSTGLLQLNFDKRFKDLRLRTEKDKGFICIEPVVCHPSQRENLSLQINPKEKLNIGFTITLLSKDI